MLSDDELQAEISEIDTMLDCQNAWLTPQFRSGLLAAREALVGILDRRNVPWPALFQGAAPPRLASGEFDRQPAERRLIG